MRAVSMPTDLEGEMVQMLMVLASVAFAGGWELPQRDADVVQEGNLSSGKVLKDLDWAQNSAVACMPAVRFNKINGSTVFIDHTVPLGQNAYIRVTPEGDYDLTLYVIQEPGMMMGQEKKLGVHPPDVQFAQGCVKSYFGAPGKEEKVKLGQRPMDQTLVIAVAGVTGVTEGAYKLEIWHGE